MKTYQCPKCNAIHRYHFRTCANCKSKNPNPPKITYSTTPRPRRQAEFEAVEFASMVHVLEKMISDSDKIAIIKSSIKQSPWIEKTLRYAFGELRVRLRPKHFSKYKSASERIQFGYRINDILDMARREGANELVVERWLGLLENLPKELHDPINRILCQDIGAGVTPEIVSKAFKKLKLKPLSTTKFRKIHKWPAPKKKRAICESS